MKYSFVSHESGSCSPFEARSTCQRQAIPTVVARKITYAARRYQPLLEAIRSIVLRRSICQIRYARTAPLRATCSAMRTGRVSFITP
jgi:hypothetical protein